MLFDVVFIQLFYLYIEEGAFIGVPVFRIFEYLQMYGI